MKNNKSFENAFCVTAMVMLFDIAISGAIIPLVGTYFGVSLMAQVAIIVVIQAILALCFYRAWKPILRNRKEIRSFDLSPNYYTEVEVIGEESGIEKRISMEEPEEDMEVKLYATIERETGMICIFAHTGYFHPNSKSKILSEMLFIEELNMEEFILRYNVKENGRVKRRESTL